MLNKKGVSKSADVYQVGVVLYEMLVGIPPFYNENMDVLYRNINKGKLKLPQYLSSEAKKCLQRILNKDPKKRPNIEQLMSDPFFADIDWAAMDSKLVDPPKVLCKSSQAEKIRTLSKMNEDE
mmetsp:Transcript_4043/g.6847  ORF Transcript_4043/g.6847 Transcript_4043/m.6847 type:complete len:123 (-) Transcript_4043:189-557(-)